MTATPHVTITARQLAALVDPVIPFASTDDATPLLTAVRITRQGRWLIATATDRYRLAFKRIDLGDEPDATGELRAVVRAQDLKQMRRLWRPTRHEDPSLTLSTRKGLVDVAAAGTFTGFHDMRVTFESPEVGKSIYPAIDRIMVDALQQPATTPRAVHVNPRLASALTAAQTSGEPATSWGGWGAVDITTGKLCDPDTATSWRFKDRPVAYMVGEDFVAAIVQVRHVALKEDGRPDVSAWLTHLTTELTTAAAEVA